MDLWKSCLFKMIPLWAVIALVGCNPGAKIQREPPAMQRGVAQGVMVEEDKQFNELKQYGIVIADSREGTHAILPADRLFVHTVPSPVLQPDFYLALNDLVAILNAYPKVTIAVVGHTDNTMSAMMQAKTSLSMARVVSDYLTVAGVKPDRIIRVEGVSDRQPIAENDFRGRQLNRRVEVIANAPIK